MSGANPERGEHDLVLAGTSHRLRPTFDAIVAIEKKSGQSLLALTRAARGGFMPLEHVGIVAAELMKAGARDELGRHVSADHVARLIYDEGLPVVMLVLTLALVDAATGGRTDTGEAGAPAGAPATGATAGASSPA